jgi:hypothetical protein
MQWPPIARKSLSSATGALTIVVNANLGSITATPFLRLLVSSGYRPRQSRPPGVEFQRQVANSTRYTAIDANRFKGLWRK